MTGVVLNTIKSQNVPQAVSEVGWREFDITTEAELT